MMASNFYIVILEAFFSNLKYHIFLFFSNYTKTSTRLLLCLKNFLIYNSFIIYI